MSDSKFNKYDWLKQDPWPERLKDDYSDMSMEHRIEFVNESWQNHLRHEYEMTLEFYQVKAPHWNDLSPDVKDDFEMSIIQHVAHLREFGIAISTGDPNKIDRVGKQLMGIDE